MKYDMILFVIAFLCLTPVLHVRSWCYVGADCNEATWGGSCSGNRQSPIHIVSTAAAINRSLTPFNLNNFDSKTALTSIQNIDYTVKVKVSGVSVSGGGLSEEYKPQLFTLHWGNRSSSPGSEHKLNDKRFPMELQILTIKSSASDIQSALADPSGVAALAILIEVDETTTGLPASWKTLTSQLDAVSASGSSANLSLSLSLNDVLPGLNPAKFYRYLGSLTFPNCEEAVVWTVFKDPVKVSKDLIDLFSTKIKDANSTTVVNNFRSIKPSQPVTYSSAPHTSASFRLLLLLALALWRS